MKLSPRLQTIAQLVMPGLPVADIGSDHGYLPIYLVSKGIVPRAVAVELQAGPWAKAVRQVRFHGLTAAIDVRRGDGLQPLKPGEAATVVIAGMGAQNIIDILTRQPGAARPWPRLVLQPMTEVPLLRKWLYAHGWYLADEELVREGRRYYHILVAEPGKKPMPEALALAVGPVLLLKKPPLLEPYLQDLLRKKRQILALLEQNKSLKAQTQAEQLQKEILAIEEVIKCP